MKRFLKILGLVLLILVLALAALVLWLTVREYKPEAVEQLEVSSVDEPEEASLDSELNILSWNIGYAGLGAESDFFMDGGEDSRSADEEQVLEYLSGIRESLDATEVDLAMLQEVDIDSGRTYRIDERDYLSLGSGVHALNYACDFVPIPLPPFPAGRGRLLVYFAGGWRPRHPCAEPLTALAEPAGQVPGVPGNLRFAATPTEALFSERCRQPRRGGTGGGGTIRRTRRRRLRWSSPPGQG